MAVGKGNVGAGEGCVGEALGHADGKSVGKAEGTVLSTAVGATEGAGEGDGEVGVSVRKYKLLSSDPNTISPDCVMAGLEPT